MDVERIKEEICDNYCKYPARFLMIHKDPDKAHEAMLDEKCMDCPLELLEVDDV